METHSSILAWRFPWTEEPDRVAESDMTEMTKHTIWLIDPEMRLKF